MAKPKKSTTQYELRIRTYADGVGCDVWLSIVQGSDIQVTTGGLHSGTLTQEAGMKLAEYLEGLGVPVIREESPFSVSKEDPQALVLKKQSGHLF